MKSLVIFPSVRDTPNFGRYAENFALYGHKPDVMVINEGPEHNKEIEKQFTNQSRFNVEFYGAKERDAWFHEQALKNPGKICQPEMLIPQRSHDELSFGLLVAATRRYDMVVFVDDDTYPLVKEDFLGLHWKALNSAAPETCNIYGRWVNTHPTYFVRGFPYSERVVPFTVAGKRSTGPVVLNMGCWCGIPDLNAMDYIVFQPVAEKRFSQRNFSLARGQFAPVCSMNLAFKPEVIPAFYQLWDNNRYNDIFSGVFLKHIADHLGKCLCFGQPLCVHEKAPRDYFGDAAVELSSIKLNEVLWRFVSGVELKGNSWVDCYRELAQKLDAKMADSEFADVIQRMVGKMLLWCDAVEALQHA